MNNYVVETSIRKGFYNPYSAKVIKVLTRSVKLLWLVPYFGSRFCPIFGQEKDEFLVTTVRSLFDRNGFNQFYMRIFVQIFNRLFCLFLKPLLKYTFINIFNKNVPRTLTYMRTKLTMAAV